MSNHSSLQGRNLAGNSRSLRRFALGRVRMAVLLAVVVALLPVGPAAAASPGTASPSVAVARTLVPGSTYHALAPVRVLDSSTGAGGAAPIVSETPTAFQMAGDFGIPVGATAIAGTLSITSQTHGGYLSLTPVSHSSAAVASSTINFPANDPRSAGVTVTLGDDGKLWALFGAGVAAQTAQFAFDLEGYYAPDDLGSTYHAIGPVRIFDSRKSIGGAAALVADVPEAFQLGGAFGIPEGATAITGTLTIANPTHPGRVVLTPVSTPGAELTTSTLSFATTDPRATGVTATLGSDGKLWAIFESAGPTDTVQFIFDLTGYFTPDMTGSTFHRLGPLRVIDSRLGVGYSSKMPSETPRSFQVTGLYGIPTGTTAVIGTLTIANPTRLGYISLTPRSTPRTAVTTSSLNFTTVDPRATTATAPLGSDGKLWAIFKSGYLGNSVNIIFDVSGYFAPDPPARLPVGSYFEYFGDFNNYPRDTNGVVVHPYAAPLGNQYNAVNIAQGAIVFFDRWQSGKDTAAQATADRASFFAQINWLVTNQQPDGRWFYTFAWSAEPVPWWSAMAEGLAISAMVRAYSVTGDASYLTVLARARSTFERSIPDLGVNTVVTVGTKKLNVYQEYLPGYVDNVLNGWIFSLAGLYDCANYLGDPMCLDDLVAADRGLPALRTLMPWYDAGWWTYYGVNKFSSSNRGPTASIPYHQLHIRQLRWLYSITGDPVFKSYADRFQRYMADNIAAPADQISPDPAYPMVAGSR